MDNFLSIGLLSLAMLVGCYVAGIIPLTVNFSEKNRSLLLYVVLKRRKGRGRKPGSEQTSQSADRSQIPGCSTIQIPSMQETDHQGEEQ